MMPYRSPRFITCALCVPMVAVLLVATSASAQTTLRWKFTPGQVLNQVISQETKSTASVGLQNIETNMNQTLDVVWKIGEVDARNVATVEAELARIRVKISNPGMDFSFDSDSETPQEGMAAMIAPAFKAMVNAKFTLKVDPRGKLLESAVSQETLDALKAIPNMGALGNMINKDTLVSMVQQGLVTLPEEPIQKGATWTDEMEMELPQIGKMTSHTKLTYDGTEEVDGKTLQCITMQLTSNIAPSEGGMFKITLKDQSSSGVLYFDNAAGRTSHSELLQQMTMSMEVAGNAIDQKMNQTIKTQLTPVGDEAETATAPSGPRTWTDASGTYQVVAEFVSASNGKVTLRKESGDLIEIPLERLCEEDKAHVAKLSAP